MDKFTSQNPYYNLGEEEMATKDEVKVNKESYNSPDSIPWDTVFWSVTVISLLAANLYFIDKLL
jgi:hypothetical protein